MKFLDPIYCDKAQKEKHNKKCIRIKLWEITDRYLADTITFGMQQPGDLYIDFLCYSNETLVKTEEKSILVAGLDLALPAIEISLNANCWETGLLEVEYQPEAAGDYDL